MSRLNRKIQAVVLAAMVLSLQVSSMAHGTTVETYLAREVIQSAVLNISMGGSIAQTEKAVLIEYYTATWCVVCALADPALDNLSKTYGPELAILEYHPYPDDQGDILGFQVGNDRMAGYYGADAFPTGMFDGVIRKQGMDSPDEDIYSTYKSYVDQRLKRTPTVNLTLQGNLAGSTGEFRASFETSGYFSSELTAKVVVFEDNIYYNYSGSNGITNHRFVVRAMVVSQGTGLSVTEPFNITGSFQVSSEWNASRLGIVAFLQADNGARYAGSIAELSQNNGEEWLVIPVVIIVLVIAALFFVRRMRSIEGK